MSLTPLTKSTDIHRAVLSLSEQLKSGGKKFQRSIGWRGGRGDFTLYWHASMGLWALIDDEHIESRYWICFGTGDPSKKKSLGITCEINPPKTGFNRRCAGVFLRDEDGAVYLGHSGKIGGGRPGVGKDRFIAAYRGRNWEAVKWPDGKETEVVVLGRINGERLLAHVAHFVQEVKRFKKMVFPDSRRLTERTNEPKFTPEFSGRRRGYAPGRIESECDHGLVVDALADALRSNKMRIANDRRDIYVLSRRNQVSVIFEAKMDLSTSSIYQAIGQLMFHSAKEPTPPKCVMVLPRSPDSTTQSILRKLGIRVLTYDLINGNVTFEKLRELL